MQRMELGEPDASGRRRPVPVEGSEFVVECDQVIAAIGQYPKLDGTSEEQGVKRTKWRTIAGRRLDLPDRRPARVRRRRRRARRADRHPGGRPGQEGRLEHGRLPARRRHGRASRSRSPSSRRTPFFNALTRQDRPRPAHRAHGRDPAGVHRHDHRRHATRARRPRCPSWRPTERRTNFKQIELGFSEDEAVRGAELCLDCYCPANGKCDLQRYGIEYEVFKNRFHGGEAHDYPADFRHDFIMREPNRCINCGRCVRVCRMEVGASCYDNMGRGFDTIVSTADNLPLQMVGCVSCGKCAETCPTGSIETNPRLLDSYDLDESRCMFCGECVEVCPYDALEQTDFFELAGFNRTTHGARVALRARAAAASTRCARPSPTSCRTCSTPRSAAAGSGTPIKDDPVDLDEPEGGA